MAIYVIGDLHLSLCCNKPMDIFGKEWENHVNKIERGFKNISSNDITVLAGDISWGISLEQSLVDFKFIDELPGRKIVLKGNHDYWWGTVKKIKQFFNDNHINTIDILHNNAFIHDDIAICGTRGWFSSEDTEHNKKVYVRELARLERSLKAAESLNAADVCCFLHYPPIYRGYECPEITDMLERFNVKACYFGHLHSNSHSLAIEETYKTVSYKLISADYLDFKPLKVV